MKGLSLTLNGNILSSLENQPDFEPLRRKAMRNKGSSAGMPISTVSVPPRCLTYPPFRGTLLIGLDIITPVTWIFPSPFPPWFVRGHSTAPGAGTRELWGSRQGLGLAPLSSTSLPHHSFSKESVRKAATHPSSS